MVQTFVYVRLVDLSREPPNVPLAGVCLVRNPYCLPVSRAVSVYRRPAFIIRNRNTHVKQIGAIFQRVFGELFRLLYAFSLPRDPVAFSSSLTSEYDRSYRAASQQRYQAAR